MYTAHLEVEFEIGWEEFWRFYLLCSPHPILKLFFWGAKALLDKLCVHVRVYPYVHLHTLVSSCTSVPRGVRAPSRELYCLWKSETWKDWINTWKM